MSVVPFLHPKVIALLERPQIVQRTPEWYEARRTLLTASDAASVLNIKPFESYKGNPRDECMKKKLENKPFSNIFVRHGQAYEDEARDLMCAALGESVIEFGLLRHPSHSWLGASPDGVTESGRCVEIKCPLRRVIQAGQVPHHYWPQIQVQMEVCNLDQTIFVQYRPASISKDKKSLLDIVVVERDRKWFADNKPILHAFWKEYMHALPTYVPEPPPSPPQCLIVDNLYY